MNKTENGSVVIGQVGHSFDIYLESMVGANGYGWCLKTFPPGVVLISIINEPIRIGLNTVRQIFTFAALKPLFDGLMEFDLLCLYNLNCECADSVSFQLFVDDKKENDLLINQIGGKKFYQRTGVMSPSNCLLKNGTSFDSSTKNSDCNIKYGYPLPT